MPSGDLSTPSPQPYCNASCLCISQPHRRGIARERRGYMFTKRDGRPPCRCFPSQEEKARSCRHCSSMIKQNRRAQDQRVDELGLPKALGLDWSPLALSSVLCPSCMASNTRPGIWLHGHLHVRLRKAFDSQAPVSSIFCQPAPRPVPRCSRLASRLVRETSGNRGGSSSIIICTCAAALQQ